MNVFFDTSALAKLFFHEENGTEEVTDLVNDSANSIWILALTRIEFHSALYRRYRAGELSDEVLQIALTGFDEQLKAFHIEPMSIALINEAALFLRRYGKKEGLRTLDAFNIRKRRAA